MTIPDFLKISAQKSKKNEFPAHIFKKIQKFSKKLSPKNTF